MNCYKIIKVFQCPKCGSRDLFFSKKDDKWVCRDCWTKSENEECYVEKDGIDLGYCNDTKEEI